jgi:hypothetical protein
MPAEVRAAEKQLAIAGHIEILEALPDMPSFLGQISSRGISGGRVYDAAIAWSAHVSGAGRLYTFNLRDFVQAGPPGLEILEP